jgi:transketolase
MPEAYQRALHEELRRELVVSITAVLAPWHETQLRAEMTDQWSRSFAAWAANNPDAAAAWTRKTTGEPERAQLSAPSGQPDRNIAPESCDNVPPGRCNYPECGGGCEGCQPP